MHIAAILFHTFELYWCVFLSHLCPFPPSAVNTRSTFRRQVVQIQPSDVIITNIRNNAQGELEFVMYIQVAGGNQVLPVDVLESAVQVTVCFMSCPISFWDFV